MRKECELSWCHNKMHAKGLCGSHLSNKRKHGVPNPPLLAKIVGTRTLLAKTCTLCGKLLMASEFPTWKQQDGKVYIKPYCTSCVIKYNKSHPPKDPNKYVRRYREKMTDEQKREKANKLKTYNSETRDTAHKIFQPWTDKDLKFALDPANGTMKERARKLGRTYKAVENRITIHRRLMKERGENK